jgi:hypothetical protein
MKNFFETKFSKEQQDKIKAIISGQVGRALLEYQQSPKYTFDTIKNLNNIQGRKIALKVVNNFAKKTALKGGNTPEAQKMLINHYKAFVKKHTGCVSNRYQWKQIREKAE